MGELGHRTGSSLHRSWKTHTKVIRKTSEDFNKSKEKYMQIKEAKALSKEFREIQQQIIREKVDKIKAQKQARADRSQKKITIDPKKVRGMSKKQIRSMGIIKE
ncbi:hypothetical protein SS50377_26753 [Spironucleus salmonicida]|uniref:Coiled-coil domain-containing protein 86 n=1 Tax=Spironucleus salmonicida TaxID=348837 RepID=V6LX71_9EUKA|nr:hypothetical protein SS50377_26753 [Spironucleus salmonicida]|eukprot:EST49222.1 Hypothetical protein SS50377_10441 [Spironucleus salmonicida]